MKKMLCRLPGHKYEHKPSGGVVGNRYEKLGINRHVCSRCGKKILVDTNIDRIIEIEED